MKKEVLVRRDVFFAVCAAYLTIPVVIFMFGKLKAFDRHSGCGPDGRLLCLFVPRFL